MRRILIMLTLLLASAQPLLAVPAKPCTRQIRLQDGSVVTATLCGDEHLHFFQLQDGRLALPEQGGTCRLTDRKEITQLWDNQLQKRNSQRIQRMQRRAANRFEGQKKGLIILVNFTDVKFSCSNLPQVTFHDFFNKPGFSEFGMKGSVHDYFYDQSYGKLDIQFDVVGPITLNRNMTYYGENKNGGGDARPGEMVAEACQKIDAQVNFQDYDWDGDGAVDQVFVVYAGYGEAQGAPENTIWPHEWGLASSDYGRVLRLDDMDINTYACSCELRGASGSSIDGIGTACHEFSHCLGLPDMYDTKGENFGMGCWDLMGSGNYNGDARVPSAYTSYERWMAGWLTPTEINATTYIKDMQPIEDSPEAYILYNDGNRNEYYLLENRQQKGWDAAQQGHGLLVVHVDYDSYAWATNSLNSVEDHQRMTIIPADGVASKSSLKGDPFPGSMKKTSLTDTTDPAAKLYNENTDGTFLMGKPLEDITESADGKISFAAMRDVILAPEVYTPEMTSPTSFLATWSEVKDATGYEISVTERLAPFENPEDAIMLSEDFAGCYSKTSGYSNIASSLDDYLSTSGFTGEYLYTSPDMLKLGRGSNMGKLTTPLLSVPNNGDMTIKMHLKPAAPGNKNTVFLVINSGDRQLSASLKLNEEHDYVLHADGLEKDFTVSIYSTSIIFYISELSVYDGTFSEEQLGVVDDESSQNSPASTQAMPAGPRRLKSYTYTSTVPSYEFKDVDSGSIFYYRVRAVTPLGYSKWSVETEMNMRSLTPVLAPLPGNSYTPYFDLQGRQVPTPAHGLYIHNGRKVMVK